MQADLSTLALPEAPVVNVRTERKEFQTERGTVFYGGDNTLFR